MKTLPCKCGSSTFYIEEKISGTGLILFDVQKQIVDYGELYASLEHKPAKTKVCAKCQKRTKFDYQEITNFREGN